MNQWIISYSFPMSSITKRRLPNVQIEKINSHVFIRDDLSSEIEMNFSGLGCSTST